MCGCVCVCVCVCCVFVCLSVCMLLCVFLCMYVCVCVCVYVANNLEAYTILVPRSDHVHLQFSRSATVLCCIFFHHFSIALLACLLVFFFLLLLLVRLVGILFAKGLETTATFDVERDEFIIHSPTVTSTKVWIGMAGQSATHTVVLAQLMINGENHGIHWFIVQLRRCESGELMPGVTAGDIGHKAAR
jgi:hypothetical protein